MTPLLTDIEAVWASLNDEERHVWLTIGRRIAKGREAYGPMDLHRDPRNFRHEAFEEAADLVVYLAMDRVRG